MGAHEARGRQRGRRARGRADRHPVEHADRRRVLAHQRARGRQPAGAAVLMMDEGTRHTTRPKLIIIWAHARIHILSRNGVMESHVRVRYVSSESGGEWKKKSFE